MGYLDDEPAAFARFPLAMESGRVPAYDGGFDAPLTQALPAFAPGRRVPVSSGLPRRRRGRHGGTAARHGGTAPRTMIMWI